jgi:hypothetical protein
MFTGYGYSTATEATRDFTPLISRTATFSCRYSYKYQRAAVQVSKKYDAPAKLLVPGIIFICIGTFVMIGMGVVLLCNRDLLLN